MGIVSVEVQVSNLIPKPHVTRSATCAGRDPTAHEHEARLAATHKTGSHLLAFLHAGRPYVPAVPDRFNRSQTKPQGGKLKCPH
jgi:hypothetical protein